MLEAQTEPINREEKQKQFKELMMNFRANIIWRAVYSTVLHRKQVDKIKTVIDSLNPKIHATADDVIKAFDGLTQLGALVRDAGGYRAKVTQFIIPEDLFTPQEQIDMARALISQVNSLLDVDTNRWMSHAATFANKPLLCEYMEAVTKLTQEFEKKAETDPRGVDGYQKSISAELMFQMVL